MVACSADETTPFLRIIRATVVLMWCLSALAFCFYFPVAALCLAFGFFVGAFVAAQLIVAAALVAEKEVLLP